MRHPILSTQNDMLILVSSLLFNNRPSSNHLLSKGKAHFLSFVFFSVLWFGELSPVSEKLITLTGITVLACMWTIPAGLECSPDAFRNGHAQVWCGFTISEAVLGWLLFSLCKPNTLPPSSSDIIYLITKMASHRIALSLAFIIYKQSSKIGLQWNISPSEKPRISIGGIPYNPYC